MRLIIIAAIALAPATSGATSANSATTPTTAKVIQSQPVEPVRVFNPFASGKDCPDTPMSLARKKAERPTLRHLDELPPSEAFAAVDRRIDNCPAPMYLRETKGR